MILEIKINKEDFVRSIEEYFFQNSIEDIKDGEAFNNYCVSCLQEILANEAYSIVDEKEMIMIAIDFLQEKINRQFEKLKEMNREEE